MTLIATLLLTAAVASAQTNFKVTGKVTDEEGEVLIGVSIKASNSKAGAMTDIDGKYTISLNGPTTL